MSVDAATIQQAYIGTAELLAMTTVTATVKHIVTALSVPNSSSDSPTTGTIVGAAVGGSAILVVGAVIIAALLLKRRREKQHPVFTGPISPLSSSSPGMTTHAGGMGFHHPTGSCFAKTPEHFQTLAHSPGHSTLEQSYPQQVYQNYPPPPPQHSSGYGSGDAIYQAYRPPQSPGLNPISPTPREMDARSMRSAGGISRKPVAGHGHETPPMPFVERMH
ncbi:uncharacterized protein RCO7_07944 [Rhynchosporium graminicola]|uniref:Uncharacterized protein n=1 Tax=Rhynchosporium graminicola TaxID=2792576 RepID=A0A1E1KNS6_9HELO|nr:uncharacterized protein RCO7_07944 [Rhynchosporium commune]